MHSYIPIITSSTESCHVQNSTHFFPFGLLSRLFPILLGSTYYRWFTTNLNAPGRSIQSFGFHDMFSLQSRDALFSTSGMSKRKPAPNSDWRWGRMDKFRVTRLHVSNAFSIVFQYCRCERIYWSCHQMLRTKNLQLSQVFTLYHLLVACSAIILELMWVKLVTKSEIDDDNETSKQASKQTR